LEEEQNDVFNNKMKQKALNKKTWQAQMAVKKSAVNAEVSEPLYSTSLRVGEADASLFRTIRPTTMDSNS